jgi:hypothetical protein
LREEHRPTEWQPSAANVISGFFQRIEKEPENAPDVLEGKSR